MPAAFAFGFVKRNRTRLFLRRVRPLFQAFHTTVARFPFHSDSKLLSHNACVCIKNEGWSSITVFIIGNAKKRKKTPKIG